MMTMRLSCTDTEIRGFKDFGVTSWPFGVTWRHRSRDHRTRREHFPIGGQWWPCAYLAQLWRYGASKILGSPVWPFGVMWRHRSRDHRTRRGHFPISGQWWPCVYLAPLRSYRASRLHLPMLKAKSPITGQKCYRTVSYTHLTLPTKRIV